MENPGETTSPEELKMKTLDKPVKIISLIFQIIFLIGSVAMLAAVIASFAAADSFGNFRFNVVYAYYKFCKRT